MLKAFLEAGKIVNVHGLRGEMKVQSWCDSPSFLTRFSTLYLDERGERALTVTRARVHSGMVLLTAQGIDTMEQAEALRNRVVYLRREDADLPEGTWFWQDLMGCRLLDETTGEEYGILEEISNLGASDVWQVRLKNGKAALIPAIPDVVKEERPEEGWIRIAVMKGMFDNAD